MGTDRNQAVMRTGPQVQRLNAYSITSLFNTARNKFYDLVSAGRAGRGHRLGWVEWLQKE